MLKASQSQWNQQEISKIMLYSKDITETEMSWDLDDDKSEFSLNQRIMNQSQKQRSVLIIGATGSISVEVLLQLSQSHSESGYDVPLNVFGLTRDMKTVSRKTNEAFSRFGEALIEGDPSDSLDLQRALSLSNADTVIVAIGSGKRERTPTARALNAEVLSHVLEQPPFRHVRLVVLSSSEAARQDVQSGNASPKTKSVRRGFLPQSLKQGIARDHAAQEAWFLNSPTLAERTTILRSAPFVPIPKNTNRRISKGDDSSADTFSSTSTLLTTEEFALTTNRHSRKMSHRHDVASWIAEEALRPKYIGQVRMGSSIVEQ